MSFSRPLEFLRQARRSRSRRRLGLEHARRRRRWSSSIAPFEALEQRCLLAGEVVINELHYNPDVSTQLVEFIELYNNSDAAVDLSNWSFGGVSYVFPQGATIPARGYYVITENASQFQSKFGFAAQGAYSGKLSNDGETIELRNASGEVEDMVDYQPGFPWPTVGDRIVTAGDGHSIQLIHPSLVNDVGGSWRSARPTPAAQNSVFALNAPPAMRKVTHTYSSNGMYAAPGDTVTITVLATDPDGVQSVALAYQVVDPGQYIEINTPAYNTNWTTVVMYDDGTNGDETASDGIYTVVLPASLQQHRRLIRYRITATDTLGASITGPYADDPQPNFAYYVYGETPAWIGAARPGVTPPVVYSPVLLDSLPTYHLITTRADHETSQRIPNSTQPGYTGSDYLWQGALVYNGEVYDHVNYRARGGVWRYAMGKNMWKFDFNRGHEFQAHDDYGRPYDVKWTKLNFSAIIQQGNFLHRGEQGLFEAVGFKLFNLAGVEGALTHFVHFRIVENANENGVNQYSGDFQGLYLVIEQPDGRMLDQHDLPNGNFYKMEGGTGSLNNQGPTQPSDKSDLNLFQTTYINSTPSEEWWRENLDLDRYYSYRSIVEAIHHYDIDESAGKNYFYYHNPETGKWSVHPWDLDLTWANNMFGGGREPFRDRVLPRPEFGVEYRNRLREIRDLLYNPEQTGMIIDEFAQFVYTPGQPSWVDADRAMWDYNPILVSSYVNSSKAGHGRFYEQAATKDFPGMMQIMKNYVVSRGAFIDNNLLTDTNQVPLRPTINYTGAASFPSDTLTFSNSAFTSPAGSSFQALEWRIAEISDPLNPSFDPAEPRKYEITPTWQSGSVTAFSSSATIPGDILSIGETYRVRVRYQDAAGRWSHWSQPVQFIAGAPLIAAADKIRVTELNYHPAVPTAAEIAAGFNDKEAFEFLELQNIHSQPVNLVGFQFTQGINFTFPSMTVQPGERVVIVGDQRAFEFRYGFSASVAGQYSGRLNNAGERLAMVTGGGQTVIDFAYSDTWHPSTDGPGMSLVILDPSAPLDIDPGTGRSVAWSSAASWRASTNPLGSPGLEDPAAGNTPPAMPTDLTGTSPSWSQVRLEWTDASTNESGFKVERRTGTTGAWSEVASLPASTQTFLDTNLLPVAQYFYRVRAYNTAGVSAGTAPVSVTTLAPPVPAAPSNLTADSSLAGQIDLSWTDNSTEETLFRIERKTGVQGAWVEIATVDADVTTYTSTGLMPNTTYFFRVRAANTGGNSDYSNEASATTGVGVPNLVGQWLFDDPSGDNNVRDTSFTGNHATLNNGVQRIIGASGAQAGNAVQFDGINDFISTSQNLAPILGETATLVTWVRTTQTGNNTFWQAPGITGVEQAGGGNDIFWGWLDATGRIGMMAGNAAGAKSAQPINDNQWHHIALTRNATTGRVEVYVDGVLSGSAISEPGLKTTPFNSIGRIQDTNLNHKYFNGRLDELQIFDRVLSQAEIQSLRLTNVVRQGTAGNDTFIINRSTTGVGYIRIYLNQGTSGTPWYAIHPDVLGSLQLDGLAGNDSLSININSTAGYPLRAGGLVFNGGDGNDSLTINGNTLSGTIPHSFNGGGGTNTLTVNSGQISIDAAAAGGVLNTTVATSAHIATARLNQNGLTVNGAGRVTILPGGSQVNVLTSLTLSTSATLDINDQALVIDYSGVSPANTIRQRILSGRGGPGLGASWSGPGITSSVVASANAQQPESRSIGFADNATLPLGAYTTFRGYPVDPTSLLIAYTRTGDANLDGVVNDDDVTVLGASYAPGAANGVWALGDFDYSGFIDDDDVTLLGAFYNPASAPLAAPPLPGVSGGVVSGESAEAFNGDVGWDKVTVATAGPPALEQDEGAGWHTTAESAAGQTPLPLRERLGVGLALAYDDSHRGVHAPRSGDAPKWLSKRSADQATIDLVARIVADHRDSSLSDRRFAARRTSASDAIWAQW